MNWEIAAAFIPLLIAVVGLVFHAGVMHERMRKLRSEHDALKIYAENISHKTVERLSERIHAIQLFLVKHVKNGIDEL